ncbi:MAG TPA: NAD-dependent epimerase/dehydratase family protein [Polyangia bacterium]|nr:NAD-dependent epimerase/dehydratase family protein [Polyangia bacterium]
MRILLTGAAGFIGSHLAERLTGRGDHVVGLDNFDAFYPRAVKERNLAALASRDNFDLVEGDITSPADLARAFERGRPELVVHLAALAGVRPSIANPLRYGEVNVTGTLRVLEACARASVGHLVFASSSSVYGVDSAVPFRESDACGKPASPYAATKRSGELSAFVAHHLQSLDVTCLRFFTVYGPRQRPDLAIHKFTRLIDGGQAIELYGDGSTSRDYTWIDDIIDGTVAAIDEQMRLRVPGYRLYNLGGSRTTSLLQLVELISDALGKKPVIGWRPEQPGDMRRTLADLTLAGSTLGYAPRVAIDDGIGRFVKWWRSLA